ncbi:hypothetical protein BJX61DRAFT_304092 [Aspergillus egyptiacus]|nr:hypothetical protein BJX61DRAFT_304092 [Aspergillus egyptiacus]
MTPCDGTARSKYWCCGDNNNACCGTPAAVTIPAQFARESPTPTPSPSNNATTPSSTPSSTPSPNDDSSSLSAGAKAGVGVGVGVGSIAIIGCLVFYFLRRRRGRRSTRTMAAPAELGTGPVAGQREVQELDQSRVYEKPAGAEDSRSELPG